MAKPVEQKRIHPYVKASYMPRAMVGGMGGLLVASTLLDPSTLLGNTRLIVFAVGMGLLWPHLSYYFASRSGDTKAAGLRALFLWDALISGLWVALAGFQPLAAGVLLGVLGSMEIIIGGFPLLIKASPSLLAGMGIGYVLFQVEPQLEATLLTTLVAVLFVGASTWMASHFNFRLTKDLIYTRRDLRRRKEETAEQAGRLKKAVEEITAINTVAQTVNSTLDFEKVMQTVHDSLQRVFDFNQMGILLLDEEGQRLVLATEVGRGFDPEVLARLKQMTISLHESESSFAVAARDRRTVYLPRISHERLDLISPADRAIYLLNPAKALLIYPLIVRENVIGVLYFGHTEDYFDLSEGDLQRIERYVTQLATAIQNAQLFQAGEEARAAAIEASRAKSHFLANMSHELRTPMNAIIGYSEMLQEDAEDEGREEIVADLKKIRLAGQHLLELINGVLDLSKIEAGKMELDPEVVDVTSLVAEVVDTVGPLVKKNGSILEVDCPDDIGQIHTDVAKVRQSLFNLLSNAAKFTENGSVNLAVVRSQEGGEDWIRFVVTDNGIGMTQEQMGRLFEAFSQADASTTRKFGGTGLGLAISKKFCELMGGDISVQSELGKGTTFTIRLPSETAAATSREPSDTVKAAKPSRAMMPPDRDMVLVIDDDPAVRDLMDRWLTRDGFHTEVAASGQQGLQLARELRPAVITLDVLMPQMDGWAVLKALKADPDTAGIPVVMLTIVDDAATGFALGAVDYLDKPIEREHITEVLRRFAGGGRDGTVLIIDDDADSRSLARSFLERQGWEVREAVDGREGLRQLAEAIPDLVMLDLIMPGMDGFDFMAEVRKHPEWSQLPVVVLTAKNLTAEERQRLNGCVHRVMRKGASSREELLQAIHDALASHEFAAARMEGV